MPWTEAQKKDLAERRKQNAKRHERRRKNSRKEAIKKARAAKRPPRQLKADIRAEASLEALENLKKEDPDIEKSPVLKELAKRELAKRHLLAYIERFNRDYDAGWVHRDICYRLEKFEQDVLDKKEPRLMLTMPPRHGKSTIASIEFPSWYLGKHPNHEIIISSYSAPLSTGFSRRIRDRLRFDSDWQVMFENVKLNPESKGVEEWKLAYPLKGGLLAAGVGGPITGKGANVFIIDDPVKNREEADSKVIRESVWNWYTSTAYTRLAPGAGVLLILTRWHDDDLAGRILSNARESGEKWEIIKYAAIAGEDEYYDMKTRLITSGLPDVPEGQAKLLRRKGEALHPARYDIDSLEKKRRVIGPRDWSALYQQQPVAEEGAYIKNKWFRLYTPASYRGMKHIQAWDLAIGQRASNDYTVGVTGALDWDGKLHVRDVVKDRFTTREIAEQIVRKHLQYNSVLVGVERGQIYEAVKGDIADVMKNTGARPTFDETLVPIHDKDVRARPMQGMMQAGDILFPDPAPAWYEGLKEELMRFPAGRNDDIFDALAWLIRMLVNVSPPRRMGHGRKKKSWRDNLRTMQLNADGGHHLRA
jgi:predicted phage terminase large subunit-like protein